MSKISQMIEYLQADNQWHTSEEIAVYLGVTSRTVKNYIKKLDSSIKVISSKKGYKIEQADIQSDEEEEIHHTMHGRLALTYAHGFHEYLVESRRLAKDNGFPRLAGHSA